MNLEERIARRVVALLDQRDLERTERLATALWDTPPQTIAEDYWAEYTAKEAAYPPWWQHVAGWWKRGRQ